MTAAACAEARQDTYEMTPEDEAALPRCPAREVGERIRAELGVPKADPALERAISRAIVAEGRVIELREQLAEAQAALAKVAVQCEAARAKEAEDAPCSARAHRQEAAAIACAALGGPGLPWRDVPGGCGGWTCAAQERAAKAEASAAASAKAATDAVRLLGRKLGKVEAERDAAIERADAEERRANANGLQTMSLLQQLDEAEGRIATLEAQLASREAAR